MKKIILSLTILFFAINSYGLSYKILAIVNGKSISTEQIRDRAQLVINSSGMKDTTENKKKITEEMAEILINEELQKQEAEAKGISYSDKEIAETVAELEKRNKLNAGGLKSFISQKGLSYTAMMDQIKANIIWKKILARYVRPGISVTKDDIKKATAEIKPAAAPMVRVNLSEIVIPVEFGKETEAKDIADTIVRTARSGAKDFGELALKYSVGKTAKDKGKVGWMPENAMIEPLLSNIKKTNVGSVSEPIKVQSLYVIIKVNDRETIQPEPQGTPEEMAMLKKMEEGAKAYMKKLRDDAYIEKKYDDKALYNFVWGG